MTLNTLIVNSHLAFSPLFLLHKMKIDWAFLLKGTGSQYGMMGQQRDQATRQQFDGTFQKQKVKVQAWTLGYPRSPCTWLGTTLHDVVNRASLKMHLSRS
jgi:hypothetical protein